MSKKKKKKMVPSGLLDTLVQPVSSVLPIVIESGEKTCDYDEERDEDHTSFKRRTCEHVDIRPFSRELTCKFWPNDVLAKEGGFICRHSKCLEIAKAVLVDKPGRT